MSDSTSFRLRLGLDSCSRGMRGLTTRLMNGSVICAENCRPKRGLCVDLEAVRQKKGFSYCVRCLSGAQKMTKHCYQIRDVGSAIGELMLLCFVIKIRLVGDCQIVVGISRSQISFLRISIMKGILKIDEVVQSN